MVREVSSQRADGTGLATKAVVRELDFYYDGSVQALKAVNLVVPAQKVTALIGPSGCGKTTLLRCFNRMHDLYPGHRYRGEIWLDGVNILDRRIQPIDVRLRVGMVFQRPNPFPKSIYDNVAYGLRVQGVRRKEVLDTVVERALRGAALWEEVKDRLRESAYALSGGQQQRLCIARAIATDPDLVLFDEPTSALDPIATAGIEDLINHLKQQVTILIVTHSMQQAARLSDYTAFMYLGELLEFAPTNQLFNQPHHERTQAYVSGQFG